MQFELVTQDDNADACGQACVAMVTGTGLNTACYNAGHDGRLSARKISSALRSYGWMCPSRTTEGAPAFGNAAITIWRGPRGRGHWVLWTGQEWLCPTWGKMSTPKEGWKPERFLPISKP